MDHGDLAYALWGLLRRTPADVELTHSQVLAELRCSVEELSEAIKALQEAMVYAHQEQEMADYDYEESPDSPLPEPSKEMRDLFAFA